MGFCRTCRNGIKIQVEQKWHVYRAIWGHLYRDSMSGTYGKYEPMKTITREYNVYNYDELSKESQSKVLKDMNDINVDYEWHKYTIEDMEQRLETMGYKDAKIGFSGFWSQGDGAHFTASVDVAKFLKFHKLISKYRKVYRVAEDCTLTIKHRGHYEHEMLMYTDSETYGLSDAVTHELIKLESLVLEMAREEARDIYKTLEKEYDYLTSDEAIIETIKSNEYTFLEDGKLFT